MKQNQTTTKKLWKIAKGFCADGIPSFDELIPNQFPSSLLDVIFNLSVVNAKKKKPSRHPFVEVN